MISAALLPFLQWKIMATAMQHQSYQKGCLKPMA